MNRKFFGKATLIGYGARITGFEVDSVNLGENIYEAGEVYKSTCVYEIEVRDK